MGIISLFRIQLKLILYYLSGLNPVLGYKISKDFAGIVTVFRVKEIISCKTSKGDQSVSSIKNPRNTFLMVNIKNFAFLSLLKVIVIPSSAKNMASPRLSCTTMLFSNFLRISSGMSPKKILIISAQLMFPVKDWTETS